MTQDHLDDFFTFLRFPSISTDDRFKGNLVACADWLKTRLTNIGLETKLIDTELHPIVWARTKHDPAKRTVLIYGHYDVQPPDPVELWDSPPFQPTLRDGLVFARGATDNKGQVLAHLLGVEATLREEGALPVNLHFVIEGEEEVGSVSLGKFLQDHRKELQSDVAIVSDSELIAPGVPTLAYGLRGLAALEVRVVGPARDLHSGLFGGAVANPIAALVELVASLRDREGHILVPGFYDDVAPIEEWERQAWKNLPVDIDAQLLEESGSPILWGEKGFTSLERLWARPTLELNGISGGYEGTGSKTVIPSYALAKITCRLVPNQDPASIMSSVEQHLRRNCPAGIELRIEQGHTGRWYLTDPNSPIGTAAQRALREVFHREVALIRGGGSIPIVSDFRDVLGMETLLLGLGMPDCRMHSPNESFPVENLEKGIQLNRILLRDLATTG